MVPQGAPRSGEVGHDQAGKVVCMKARFDDHVITTRAVALSDGSQLPEGTHGFVVEAFDSPETYEVEFDLGDDVVLTRVEPEDFGLA